VNAETIDLDRKNATTDPDTSIKAGVAEASDENTENAIHKMVPVNQFLVSEKYVTKTGKKEIGAKNLGKSENTPISKACSRTKKPAKNKNSLSLLFII